MHLWKHLDWVLKLLPLATIHEWKTSAMFTNMRHPYHLSKNILLLIDIFKYIYLYRALLKYANFAKSCQAKGKSWVMLGQVEKAGWKDEFWSPGWKDLKVCSKVHMTKWTMYSYGQTLCSHSHLCMITRYDHILYDHMRLCNDRNHSDSGHDHILTIS